MEINNLSGLLPDEEQIMTHIVDAWKGFIKLKRQHPSELDDFERHIHALQYILAGRIVIRLYPKYWVGDNRG